MTSNAVLLQSQQGLNTFCLARLVLPNMFSMTNVLAGFNVTRSKGRPLPRITHVDLQDNAD